MTIDPLSKLVSDDFKAEDRKKLADILLPFVIIDNDTQRPNFKESFYKIENNNDKLELILITEKARALFFEKGENEGLRPTDIISLEIIPEGSVKTGLKRLFDSGKIKKKKSGEYFLPNYRLPELFSKYLNKNG